MNIKWRTGIGQDSHRFVRENEAPGKVLMLGGVPIPGTKALAGNSDADIILHALCNAISSVTGIKILGGLADTLCRQGITDSSVYFAEALKTLEPENNPGGRRFRLSSMAVSVEAKTPKLAPYVEDIRRNLAALSGLEVHDIGLTATTGEGLTAVGSGEGMACICTVDIIEIREKEVQA